MRSHTGRLYAFAATLVLFFVLWAAIAARPWASTAAAAKPTVDPRLVALNREEHRLQRKAALVERTVNRRWAEYRRRLRAREVEIAAVKRRHAQQVAAAQAAQARIAAMEATTTYAASAPAQKTVTTYDVTRVQSAPVAAQAAPAPAARVVTLPPVVKIVTLPPATAPATTSTSSRP